MACWFLVSLAAFFNQAAALQILASSAEEDVSLSPFDDDGDIQGYLNRKLSGLTSADEPHYLQRSPLRPEDAGMQALEEFLVAQKVSTHRIGSVARNDRCPSGPKIWLLMTGQYRTFSWVHPQIVKTMEDSVGECFHAVAVVSDRFFDANDKANQCDEGGTACVSSYPNTSAGVAAQLADDAKSFDGRLSYIVIQRVDNPNYGYAPQHGVGDFRASYTYVAWAMARHIARTNGVSISPSSLVVLSRPDMAFSQAIDADPLIDYFARSDDRRLRLTQINDADLSSVMSFASFDWNIGYTLDVAIDPQSRRSFIANAMAASAAMNFNFVIFEFDGTDRSWCLDNDGREDVFNLTDCKHLGRNMLPTQSALQNNCICRTFIPGNNDQSHNSSTHFCPQLGRCMIFRDYQDSTNRHVCTQPEVCINLDGSPSEDVVKVDLTKNLIRLYNADRTTSQKAGEELIDYSGPKFMRYRLSARPFDLSVENGLWQK
eukprot:TRINITY_DN72098_c0_g1_i1.p1 TRINITY_DN72098_c0_g1~~TRINITY_DN72098_c0_g1_i1.p1  ORF type:complete len:507 (+),score=72.29 TRINITY_DN72098_c0_g1_i1:61-1521(+)